MSIRMRRGNLADFDPTKQMAGEFAVSIDQDNTANQRVYMAFQSGVVKQLMTVQDAEAQIEEAVEEATEEAVAEATAQAGQYAEDSEAYAIGKRGGTIVPSTDPAYHNNSKYYSEQASASATTAGTKAGEAATSASNAATSATNAGNSATAAGNSATAASNSATTASNEADEAEAWADGNKNGTPVPSSAPQYHNNAKYWAEQASQAAGGGVTSFNGRSGSVSPQSGDYTAAMVGLGNVDNTSDLNKPISTATQTALNGKADTSSLTDGSVTKIGTGNVGSATQPVYINGGVPTAAWTQVTREIPDGSTAGWYKLLEFNLASSAVVLNMSTWNPTVSGDLKGRFLFGGRYGYQHITFIGGANGGNSTKFRITGNDFGTGYLEAYYEGSGTGKRTFTITPLVDSVTIYSSPTASSETTAKASIEILPKARGITTSAQVRQPIVTRTPTSPNSNCSFDSGRMDVKKSGNVVEVNVRMTINTSFTPSETTQLFILPYKPVSNCVQLGRVSGIMGEVNDTGRVEVNSSSGGVIWGTSPYAYQVAGTKIWVTGTYLTND